MGTDPESLDFARRCIAEVADLPTAGGRALLRRLGYDRDEARAIVAHLIATGDLRSRWEPRATAQLQLWYLSHLLPPHVAVRVREVATKGTRLQECAHV